MVAEAHPHRPRRRRFHVHPAALGDWYDLYHGVGAVTSLPSPPTAPPLATPMAPLVAPPPAAPAPALSRAEILATVNEEMLAEQQEARRRARKGMLVCLAILLVGLAHLWLHLRFGSYLSATYWLSIGRWW